ncbi:MAG: hypothetical protein RR672_12820 [Raoultibacter sp.]
MFYDILKAIPAIILCYILWRYVMNNVERDRHLIKAQEHYNCGRLDRGNVWVHLKTGRPYTVLCLTNTGTSKAGWEINVIYTNDFQQIYNRPFSEFCHKFHHLSRGSNDAHFNTTLDWMQMEANTRITLPKEGEIWVESSRRNEPPQKLMAQGHVAKVYPLRARIDMVLGLGEAHPVVVFTVNESKQTAMLLSQFIFIYHKEATSDGTNSSGV